MNTPAPTTTFSQEYAQAHAKSGQKLKIYQLGISKTYLQGHPKAGQPTNFRLKIEQAMLECMYTDSGHLLYKGSGSGKIHTCRPNYEYWKRIEEKVNSGQGILSLRQWEGKPYNSKRPEFMCLTKMRVDHLVITTKGFGKGSAAVTVHINGKDCTSNLELLAMNDGLENGLDLIQWLGWKGFDGALIHFIPEYHY